MKEKITLFNRVVDLSAAQQQWNRMKTRIRPADAYLVGISLAALAIGVFVDIFLLRLFCVLVVGVSSLFVYTNVTTHYSDAAEDPPQDVKTGMSIKKETMKKLIFDDFQFGSVKRHEEGEVSPTSEEQSAPVSPAGNKIIVNTTQHNFKILKPEVKPVAREFHVGDFFDVDSDIFKNESEPRTEFDFLLNKVLVAIKETVFAHTAIFFWANREKQQMVMEARATESSQFVSSRRFTIGHDLVSKVAEQGKPELMTEVNPLSERELFPYYDTAPGVKSFVGVPVFFSNGSGNSSVNLPVAVIAVDSKAEGAFGDETVALLGQFTKLISALIKNYTNKYDLLVEAEVLSSVRRLQERFRNDFSQASILESLAEESSRLVAWDFLSIVLFDEKKRAWVAKKVMNRVHEPYIAPEQIVDFTESISGRAIKNTLDYVIDNLETTSLPRYHKGEKAEARGSFVSVPICSVDKCYGALNIESRTAGSFSRQDVENLHRLCETTALGLDIFFKNDVINEYVIIDEKTGVYSKKFFFQRMNEELQRSDDNGQELSMLMVAVDYAQELEQRFGKEGFDRVMATLAKAIRSSIRQYDMVGRVEQNKFGVLLMNTTANESYLWAEKIRKNVAAHVISYEGKNFSVTISVGVAGAMEGMKSEELLVNTKAVLQKAAEAGGNAVRVF